MSGSGAPPADHVTRSERWRTGVTILIGVASLLGALTTWRLTTVSGDAGGADARAVEDTITQEQNRSSALLVTREEGTAFARVKGYETAAAELEGLAGEAEAGGRSASANALRGEAQAIRELGLDLLDRYPALRDTRYVGSDENRFDALRRRQDLELNEERVSRKFPAPRNAISDASAARSQTRELGLVVLLFALSIFFLALAEKLREYLDARFATAGALVLAGAIVMTLVVW